jgi:hypothetical protein
MPGLPRSLVLYLEVLLMIFLTRLESFSNMENAWLAEATTGGGSEFENRYGLKEK